ncbi:IS66 family insertion sequence element accessory protein TnpA [Clostridium kluyveri]|uniref:IS66 family insertion sequence element accessory protein TnpA n=1 Tax=Clostridium kluyveri TaxID=1534 RepID=UPI0022451EEC|nr:IS66 family insertion sequence element accessory protein TnpB [Clostridium kluyveri]UZQ49572.1 IS66 family insertion sequence element accessory protein TnpB [Clostridium kluyveri]
MDVQKATQEYRMNEWIKIIGECRSSGQTVKSWCLENGIRTTRYYYWLRKIRAVACEALPSISSQEQIVPVDTSKLSNVISEDIAYVSSKTAQADIIVRLGPAVLKIHNSASYSLIENVIKVLQNVR